MFKTYTVSLKAEAKLTITANSPEEASRKALAKIKTKPIQWSTDTISQPKLEVKS